MEATSEELVWYFETVLPHVNERQRRVIVGATASLLGRGGKTMVADAAGMSRNTVIRATSEVQEGVGVSDRQRVVGGGDKPAIDKQPGLLVALDELVHPSTRGNPMSMARWTSKSTYELADELVRQGYSASAELVRRLLHQLGYRLQAPSKQKEGTQSPDRDAQFNYLNDTAVGFVKDGQPVISCDTKKKELVGEFSNGGAEWHPRANRHGPRPTTSSTRTSDSAVPYGVYDIENDEGWVSVGDTADTGAFAVEAIRRWWYSMGQLRFPDRAQAVDHRRCRGVQRASGQTLEGRTGQVRPRERPRDHRLPLPAGNFEVEPDRTPHVQLHLHGTGEADLRLVSHHHRADLGDDHQERPQIKAERDWNYYETGVQVSKAELAALPLFRHEFHGDWNYSLAPAGNPAIEFAAGPNPIAARDPCALFFVGAARLAPGLAKSITQPKTATTEFRRSAGGGSEHRCPQPDSIRARLRS